MTKEERETYDDGEEDEPEPGEVRLERSWRAKRRKGQSEREVSVGRGDRTIKREGLTFPGKVISTEVLLLHGVVESLQR